MDTKCGASTTLVGASCSLDPISELEPSTQHLTYGWMDGWISGGFDEGTATQLPHNHLFDNLLRFTPQFEDL